MNLTFILRVAIVLAAILTGCSPTAEEPRVARIPSSPQVSMADILPGILFRIEPNNEKTIVGNVSTIAVGDKRYALTARNLFTTPGKFQVAIYRNNTLEYLPMLKLDAYEDSEIVTSLLGLGAPAEVQSWSGTTHMNFFKKALIGEPTVMNKAIRMTLTSVSTGVQFPSPCEFEEFGGLRVAQGLFLAQSAGMGLRSDKGDGTFWIAFSSCPPAYANPLRPTLKMSPDEPLMVVAGTNWQKLIDRCVELSKP